MTKTEGELTDDEKQLVVHVSKVRTDDTRFVIRVSEFLRTWVFRHSSSLV